MYSIIFLLHIIRQSSDVHYAYLPTCAILMDPSEAEI